MILELGLSNFDITIAFLSKLMYILLFLRNKLYEYQLNQS